MKKYGRTTVGEFLGDFIVYRNLVPVESRLPPLAEISEELDLEPGRIPRKTSAEYARVIAQLVEKANQLQSPGSQIERILFIGDTHLNDGTAFRNICVSGNWPGMAFIANENSERPGNEIDEGDVGSIFLANRWVALDEFNDFCKRRKFPVDDHTAVLLDLDKTTLGARGRNDRIIDQVRLEAAEKTMGSNLGEAYHAAKFQAIYLQLNQPEFHSFTRDNQDYLVYICMILGVGLFDLDSLVAEVRSGEMRTLGQFLARVDARKEKLPDKLRIIHDEFNHHVQLGDPTPFKEFRYMEYLTTTARMGQMDPLAPVEELLAQEITITQEVREAALAWREQGALLFGLSDKPDEASLPTLEQEAEGYKPLHWIETDAVGV